MSSLVAALMVSTGDLGSPLLTLFSLLRTCEVSLDIFAIFLSNDFLFGLLSSLLILLVTVGALTSTVLLCLALLGNSFEAEIVCCHHWFNRLFVGLVHGRGSGLLIRLLLFIFVLVNGSLVLLSRSLHHRKFDQLGELLTLVVRLEETTVKLVIERRGIESRTKSTARFDEVKVF